MNNTLSFTSSIVQERMMRIGVETRILGASTVDDFYNIAVNTLKKSRSNQSHIQIKNIEDLNKLFDKQIQSKFTRFYFFTKVDEELKVVYTTNLNDILGLYSSGCLNSGPSFIPQLFKT